MTSYASSELRRATGQPVPSDGAAYWCTVAAVYALLVFWYLIWPGRGVWSTTLVGSAVFAPDAVLNLSILEWGHRSFWSTGLGVFEWPAGYPLRHSLAGTENLLGWQPLYSLLRWLGASPASAYNAIIAFSLPLAGTGVAAVSRRFNVSRVSAILSGAAFAFAPCLLAQLIQVQMIAVCWLPFSLLALDDVLAGRGWRAAVRLGAFQSITTLCSIYVGIFSAIVLAGFVVMRCVVHRSLPRRDALVALCLTGVAFSVLFIPIARPYLAFWSQAPRKYTLSDYIEYSHNLMDLRYAPRFQALWAGTPLEQPDGMGQAFPGVIVSLLAIIALIGSKERRRAWALAISAAAAFVLSLGPRLKVFSYPTSSVADIPMPGALLTEIPGLRMPLRMYLFALLFLAILGGLGLDVVLRRISPRGRRLMATAAVALLALEYKPSAWFANRGFAVPEPNEIAETYRPLTSRATAGATIELPVRDSMGYRNTVQSAYVLGAAIHGRPVTSYYAGPFVPLVDSLERLGARLPEEGARRALLALGVHQALIHRRFYRNGEADRLASAFRASGMPLLAENVDVSLFSIDKSPRSE